MACSPYLVYTGVTDTGLCTGGGSSTTVYIDSAVIPLFIQILLVVFQLGIVFSFIMRIMFTTIVGLTHL